MQTKLVNKLGQRLTMTPELTQSLKLLTMNAAELGIYVEECLESNPMLDVEPDHEDVSAEPPPEPDQAWEEDGERWQQHSLPFTETDIKREPQWQDEPTLGQSLHEQIDRQPMGESSRSIAHALVDSLEDDGYFYADVQELAQTLQVSPDTIVEVLENVVHQLEPAGLGARNLRECLLLQLDGRDAADELVCSLLLHFSDHLFESDSQLAKRAACSIEQIQKARARMRRLDPFPGHGMHGHGNAYIQPEIIFHRLPDGEFQVEVPSYAWQGLHLNEQWQGHRWQGKEREFMDSALKDAKWLLYALDQRRDTLYRVAYCLCRRQRDFLEYGPLGLKPLTLHDVADEVGLHESTISRVTTGKYAQTPLGTIEMKRFFSGGLPTSGGGTVSVFRVQQRVKVLIESEVADKPISDQAIADRLQTEGIEIARRTVAKYRELLGFPPSSARKRGKRSRQLN